MITAQVPVREGAGSYASEPPTYKSRTADHGGSWATMMQTREIFADETLDGKRRPSPPTTGGQTCSTTGMPTRSGAIPRC